jgi:hypothetical protein
MKDKPQPQLLTAVDVCGVLNVSRRTLNELVRDGRLHPPVHLGNRKLWHRGWVDEFLDRLLRGEFEDDPPPPPPEPEATDRLLADLDPCRPNPDDTAGLTPPY